ncbi:MAG: hypothetical protein KGZ93_08560 [Actinobacteria bacterium]|nr:hypothetical protein [Actinomycetota bacterium]
MDNTIACVGVCGDELSQPLVEAVNKRWDMRLTFQVSRRCSLPARPA